MSDQLQRLRHLRIVPVIVIDDPSVALPLADALIEGGLPCAEITFRTQAGLDALRVIAAERPEMLIGAGTVLSAQQAAQARAAGAQFIVSPGFGPAVVDYCQDQGVPVYPGVATPTEVEMALARGLEVVKFFPAEPMGGVAFLKAIAAPYGMLQFMPTGGINAQNIKDYLAFNKVVACGGSWMASAEAIKKRDWAGIKTETERAMQAVKGL
jgi:2-dehydro-3-deoxyphosphogluconate aldolase / (4S)-4-hydroxy-2-oxoglutarate aldolase